MDGKKRISCRRCQLRKLKCTRVHPCANCVSSSSECSFRDDDTRRRPVNRAYVAALEERLASYEATIRSLQQQSPSNPPSQSSTSLLAQTPGTSVPVAGTAVPDLIFDYSGSSRVSTLTLQPSPQGHRSFYGPTSIYQKGCVTDGNNNDGNRRDQPPPTINAYQDIYLSGIFKLEDLVLNDSLSMFFRHLNAECPFIDETALVQDFTRNKHMGKFWSYPLLYAICLLGARISRDPQVSATVDPLKRCVHKLLSFKRLQSPHITIVQAFFCLALFEFGAGNNSKGWLLSGMAVRMLQDMGLHQDPRFLVQDDSSISLAQDSQMRRKVFWGCYVTDKVISLYFGRPVHLRHDDAAVDFLDPEVCQAEAERGPELAEVDSPLYTLLDNSIPSSILLIHLADLSRIIESMMADVFSTRLIKLPRKDLVTHRVAKLEELNLRLFQWHTALPETFAWNQWTPTTQTLPPQLTILHALYHSCIISLNRHFIRPTPGFARKTQSRDICISSADSIMAITRHYRAQHSLATAPLVLVYSLAMAATAVTFALDSSVSPHDQSAELAQHMNFLVKTLNECSKTYEVASHISERLKRGPQKKKNAQREEEDEEEGGEEGGEEEEITPSSQDADADVHDCLQPAQVLPETVIPEETLQVPGAEAWGTSWWNDGVMGFAQPDNMEGQLDVLLTSGDQEGDMMANFNWSNMMI